jgi:YidC/Oxa1 family membrane protein insertase
MLIQTKLFSPPAITDEAKMNQKVMKYMMVFMAFMFYKVPSGLGIYFITSSLWQICERLLLPKITKSKPTTALAKASPSGEMEAEPTRRYTPQPSPVAKADNAKPKGWFARKMQELIEQAENERTIRNNGNGFNGRATNGSSRDQTPPDRDRKRRPKR